MIVDTHAHLNFNAYKDDADEVIRRSLDSDVWMINVGSQYSTSRRAVEIAERYEKGVYAAIGLHPIHLANGIFKTKADQEEIEIKTNEEDFNSEKYRELAESKKVVALGEIGLDYYYRPKTKTKLEQFQNKQKQAFLRQLEFARELNLPLILHCRMAHQDLIEVLKSEIPARLRLRANSLAGGRNPKSEINPKPERSNKSERSAEHKKFFVLRSQIPNSKLRGVVHCFTGTWEQARKYMELGFYIGFNGIIFKLNLDEVIEKTPLEKILIETDCPYLTPSQEGAKRNEPIFVKYVVQKIAELKKVSYNEIARITTENAQKLFRI